MDVIRESISQIEMQAGCVLVRTRRLSPRREPTYPAPRSHIAEADQVAVPAVPSGAASPQGWHQVHRLPREFQAPPSQHPSPPTAPAPVPNVSSRQTPSPQPPCCSPCHVMSSPASQTVCMNQRRGAGARPATAPSPSLAPCCRPRWCTGGPPPRQRRPCTARAPTGKGGRWRGA